MGCCKQRRICTRLRSKAANRRVPTSAPIHRLSPPCNETSVILMALLPKTKRKRSCPGRDAEPSLRRSRRRARPWPRRAARTARLPRTGGLALRELYSRPGASSTGAKLLPHRALAGPSLAAAESPEPPAFPCPQGARGPTPSQTCDAAGPASRPAIPLCRDAARRRWKRRTAGGDPVTFRAERTLRSREGAGRKRAGAGFNSQLLYNAIINQACPEFTVS